MLHDWRKRQLSRSRTIIFQRDDMLPMSKTLPATTRQPWWSIEIPQISRVPSAFIYLRLHDRDCWSGSCHSPAPSYFEEMTCCRHQKLHWRWPGNPNGRSKFRNLGLFTFTWSQLTPQRRLRGWWRLPEIAQTARSRHQKHRRDDQNWSKFRKYENLDIRNQAKRLEKLLFAATNDAAIDGIAHCFFPANTRHSFCSHIRKIISRRS